METKSGYVLNEVNCPSCKQLHDLFIEVEVEAPVTYRFSCPHTGNAAVWLCDRAAHLAQEKPEGAIHAFKHDE